MRYRTILLAIDIDAETAPSVDYAFALAEKVGATLHVLHALPIAVASGGPSSHLKQHDDAQNKLLSVLASHRGSPSFGNAIVDMNEPIRAIVRVARSVSADLVIVGTSSRRGMQRLAIGSVAQGVLEEAEMPVLILKAPSPR